MSTKKYLTDTSLALVAIGESTPEHVAHFIHETDDGVLYSSVYIRKEFIHRWVVPFFDMAACVRQYDNVADALDYLAQDFSPRKIKVNLGAIAALLRQKGSLRNTRETADEIARLGISFLCKFDANLNPKIANKCNCKIGAATCSVDFNHLFDDMRTFAKRVDTVHDCPINEFLAFQKPTGRTARFLSGDKVGDTKSGAELQKLFTAKKHVTCKECAKIGDSVIALEQPPSWHLLTCDKDFATLCAALDKPLKTILSLRGAAKAAQQHSGSVAANDSQSHQPD